MLPPIDWLTTDGYDLQFGTNVLGHFYFTELLMPALLSARKTSPDGHARVITTSSSASYLDILHFESFKDGPERRKIGSTHLYNQSKHVRYLQLFQYIDTRLKGADPFQGNIVVAREVAKRYAQHGIISISVNPGELPITCISSAYIIHAREVQVTFRVTSSAICRELGVRFLYVSVSSGLRLDSSSYRLIERCATEAGTVWRTHPALCRDNA